MVAVAIVWTMPVNPVRDLLSVIFRAFFRLEVRGLDNFAKAGPNMIVALNHVSLLDAAVALSILDREPVFAIDSGMAQRWWVRPFLRFTRAMPLDPTRPLATRTLIHEVQRGEPLIIFPEGRITVTGSLMKVYDGAAMIADKSDAMVVPVRIKGLEKTYFSYLRGGQVRRSLLPKVSVSILEPVRLTVDPALRGKRRRLAAGAKLYTIMSDLIYRTTATDRTIVEAVIAAAAQHGGGRIAVGGSGGGRADLQAFAGRRCRAGPEADGARANGRGDRHYAAQRQCSGGDDSGRYVGRPGAGDDQFHLRRTEHPQWLPRRECPHHRDVAGIRREGASGKDRGCPGWRSRDHPLGGSARRDHDGRQVARPPRRTASPRAASAR